MKWNRIAGTKITPELPNSSGRKEMTNDYSDQPLLVIAIGNVFIEHERTRDFVTGRGDRVMIHRMQITTIKK